MRIEDEIKQKRFSSAQQKAILNIMFTSGWMLGRLTSFFKPFGITAAQFNILRILRGQYPNSMQVGEIKSRMLDRNSDTPRLLSRLLAKGLIEKKMCPNDRRASNVYISGSGLALLEKINRHQAELDSMLNLTDEEALLLSNLLDKARG
ncbi:MAG: MarR family transcriptional regulator [Cyclobacteriaceae bacterium]|nr:MAG: MarR family transcriptional regulator [Cyclobacteriaceae bacterium]